MATERQIAANRRNAGKSTGLRSRGETVDLMSTAAVAIQVEKLARKIAGK